jgi:hypothetical protein
MFVNPLMSAIATAIATHLALYGTLAYIVSRDLNAGQLSILKSSKWSYDISVVHSDYSLGAVTIHGSELTNFMLEIDLSHPEALEVVEEAIDFSRYVALQAWNEDQSFEDSAHDTIAAYKSKIGFFS